MTGDLFGGVMSWSRWPVERTGYANYMLQRDGVDVGIVVRFCGDGTAHWPYTVDLMDISSWTEDGWALQQELVRVYTHPNGRGFASVDEAKGFAMDLWARVESGEVCNRLEERR